MPDARPPGATNGNGNANGVVGSITEFTNDLFTLAELQAKLAEADFQEAVSRALTPLAVTVVGALVILAGIPVALLGVAGLLATALAISPGLAMLLTALVVMAVCGILIAVFLGKLKRSLNPLRRSREELIRNLSWVRTVIVHSGRSQTKRGG